MPSIKILSYNVWFAPYKQIERINALIGQILTLDPDVICLQEVTPSIRKMIRTDDRVNAKYAWLDDDFGAYGVVIMTKLKSIGQVKVELTTQMNRNFLYVVLPGAILVGTVHLESLNNEQLRRIQLREILPHMQKFTTSILIGDFNMKANEVMPEHTNFTLFKDCLTYDSSTNPMVKGTYSAQPLDRILYRNCQLISVQMVGTAPFDSEGTYISDHYGLMAIIQV